MDIFVNWVENILLIIIAYFLFGIAFYLNTKDIENWIIRKYVHTVGLITAGLIAAFVPTLEQIILVVGVLFLTVFLFSLPPIRFLQRLTKMATREGESQKLLFINGLSTSLGFIFLVILFFNLKWVFLSAILCVAIGDGMGEFIGRPYGKHKYHIFATKSIEGSLAVFTGSLVGGVLSVLGLFVLTFEVFLIIILASFLVTVIEAISVVFIDNIAMQFAYAGTLWFFLIR